MSFGPVGMSGGMDINAMVSKVVDAERVPKQQSINSKRTQIDASISAYGQLRESLDAMKNLMANFRHEKSFSARSVETSDDSMVAASATSEAIAGRYSVDVLQLAQGHKVASDVLDKEAQFGPGKMELSLGKDSFEVQLSRSTSLKEVIRKINSSQQNPGIRAAIINDVEGPRLILASDLSGESQKISVTVDSEVTNPLKKLEYKTLEARLQALEDARQTAEAVLNPTEPNATKESPTDDAPSSQTKEPAKPAALQNQEQENDGSTKDSLSYGAQAAKDGLAALEAQSAKSSLDPNERISGWAPVASGTLLDSYAEPEPELDEFALEKAPDVPGWTNTASGTLSASYQTVKEAQQKIEQEKSELEDKLADEKQVLDEKVEKGELTQDQAQQMHQAQMDPVDKKRMKEIEETESQLAKAEQAFAVYQGMVEVQSSQDAQVILDGVAQLSSSNNVIEDAIDGVDLMLKSETSEGELPAEIGVQYDRVGVRADIEAFVAAYNNFYQTSKALSSPDPLTGEKGPLNSDSTVRNADSRLKSIFSSPIKNAPEELRSLTELGVTTTRQGTLEINYQLLDKQINNNFTKLEAFFGGNSGFAKKVEDTIHGLTGVTGAIRTREQTLVEQNYRLNDEQVQLDRRMESLEKRTHKKFAAMQDATANMQEQLSALKSVTG